MTKQGTYSEACAEVWQTLKKIDCSEHTEKKGSGNMALTYLSWAWAYQITMDHFPDFNYEFDAPMFLANGTAEVSCKVMLGHKGHVIVKSMWLPVMDHRNKALVNPDTVALNKSKMRCLTKAISMLGLGGYIYAGEDLPSESDEDNKVVQMPTPPPPAPPIPPPAAATIPQPPKFQPEPVPVMQQSEPAGDVPVITDESAATSLVEAMIAIARNMHSSSLKELTEFWIINKQTIDMLDHQWPNQYAMLKAAFTEIKASLTVPQEAIQ